MLSRPLVGSGALCDLEPWQAQEFADHLDRARDHIRPWVGPAFVTDSVDGARRTLTRYGTAAAEGRGQLFGIRVDGVLVGGVMFVSIDVAAGRAELGCWLEPAAEGKGLITAACRELLAHAFLERGIHRVEWKCRADNERSAAVASWLGMTLEGTLRDAWLFAGDFYDQQVWSILRHEYRERSADDDR